LKPSINQVPRRTGKWEEDEDIKLKNAVTLGAKNWEEITLMVPGRTRQQCLNRWHDVLDFSIDSTTARTGKWTEDENKKLREAVEAHGGKNWEEIAAMVPSRTQKQCRNRWRDTLDPSIDPATTCAGKWTEEEDERLEDAVRAHGGRSWKGVAALVPGRTQKQCQSRWQGKLVSDIDPTTARTGKGTEDEDQELKDTVDYARKKWK
jgi:myb proto-oncogene protein